MKEKTKIESLNLAEYNIAKIKEIFPEIVSDGLIDFEKLKLVLGEDIEDSNESYKFEWVGKRDCYKLVQTPSLATLNYFEDESLNPDVSKNLIIEGDNLEVLKLLQSSYKNKIKMIYMDPTYNRGDDLVYKDNYTLPLQNYYEITGQTSDGESNVSLKTKVGRKHTDWLNMIFPRLLLSRTVLKDDGVIFISIDDHEFDNLKKLCDEVFGEENHRNTIIIKRGVKNLQSQFLDIEKLNVGHEYILCYTKNTDFRFNHLKEIINDDFPEGGWNNHWRGSDRPTMRYELFGKEKPKEGQYRWSKDRSLKAIENYQEMLSDLSVSEPDVTQDEIDKWYFEKTNNDSIDKLDLLRENPTTGKPEHYIPPKDYKLLNDLWTGIYASDSNEMKQLFGHNNLFSNPKSTKLIDRLIEFVSPNPGDVVLDLFAGSGTTGQSVLSHEGINFILVQLPERVENKQEQKPLYQFLKKINKPTNIAEITKERIRRVIKNNENEKGVDGFKVFKLDKSNYRVVDEIEKSEESNNEELISAIRKRIQSSLIFDNSLIDDYKELNVVYENLIKEGFSLNSEIKKIQIEKNSLYEVSDDKEKNKLIYVCFEKLHKETIDSKEFTNIGEDTLLICFDIYLTDSDKANLSKTFKIKTM